MKCHLEELVLAGTLFHGVLHQKSEKKLILFPSALYHRTYTLFHMSWFSSCIWSVQKLSFFKDTSFDFIFHSEISNFLKKKSRIDTKEIFLQKNICFPIAVVFLSWHHCCGFWVVSQDVCVCVCVYLISSLHSCYWMNDFSGELRSQIFRWTKGIVILMIIKHFNIIGDYKA